MHVQALVARAADCNPQEVSNAYWCVRSTDERLPAQSALLASLQARAEDPSAVPVV